MLNWALLVALEAPQKSIVSVQVPTQRANFALHDTVRVLLILQHHLHQEEFALHEATSTHR